MSYTNIAKPSGASYINVNSSGKEGFDDAAVTFDQQSTFFDGINNAVYTNLSKPTVPTAILVQSKSAYTGSSPLNIAYTSPVTSGNLLVVCVSSADSSDVITISDDQNNIWTKAINSTQQPSVQFVSASIYYANANGNNIPTITLTGTDVGGSIYEYSGLSGSIDSTNATLTPGFSNTLTADNLNTSSQTVIVAMAANEIGTATYTASGGGFTLRNSNGSHIDAVSDYQNAPAGSYGSIFNFTGANTDGRVIIQVAFQVSKYSNISKPQ